MAPDLLCQVEEATVSFRKFGEKAPFLGLNRVSLGIHRKEVLAVVGASGSGKSTLARAVLGIQRLHGGRVLVGGRPWPPVRRADRRRVQGVFQDTYHSLDPRMTVEAMFGEGFYAHGLASSRREVASLAIPYLHRVGLTEGIMAQTARSLSGGERQRLHLARALSLSPDLLVLDEPVSALDASLRRGIVGLLRRLVAEENIGVLLISHDIDVALALAHRYAVMLAGRIVEEGAVAHHRLAGLHPWTQELLAAVQGASKGAFLEDRTAACPYLSCSLRAEICDRVPPELLPRDSPMKVACHGVPSVPLGASPIE